MRRARKGASGAFPAERGPFSRRMRGHHRSGHPEAAQGQSRPDVPRAAQPGGESADGARHCRSELPSSRLPIVAPSVRARWATVRAPLATASAEHDVLAYMAFGESLRLTLHSTNPLERVNKEIKRRTNVVGVRRENSAPRCFLILTSQPRGRHPPRRRVRHGSRTGGDLVAHCWNRTTNGPYPATTCRRKSWPPCATTPTRRR